MTDRVEIREQTRIEVRREPAGVDVRTAPASVEQRESPTRVEVGVGGPAGSSASASVSDEGTALGTFASINFVGPGVRATLVGTAATVTVKPTVLSDARWRMVVAV